jgi:hypothetical protein
VRAAFGAVAWAVLLAAVPVTSEARPGLERFDHFGISFEHPSDWFVTTERLSNGWDPDYRFAASTVPVQRTRQDVGPCLRGIDRQLPRDAALVFLREARTGIGPRQLRRLGPLPTRLPLTPDAVMYCMQRPALGAWVHFRAAGRAFVLGVHLGPRATKETQRELRRLVASIEIRPRARFQRFDRLGISFEYPSEWSVTTHPLSPASDPDYRFAASTVQVRRTRHDHGPCLPGVARQLPRAGALVFLREYTGASRRRALPRLDPMPGRLRLKRGSVPCGFGFRRGLGDIIDFRESRRALTLYVWVGPRAEPTTLMDVTRLVAGLKIGPRR